MCVPLVGPPEPLLEAHPGRPAELLHGGDVQKLLRHAVRFRRVEDEPSPVPRNLPDQAGQLPDRDVHSGPRVDDLAPREPVDEKQAGVGRLFYVEEFPSGPAGSPDFHFGKVSGGGLMEPADQRGNHVGVPGVEVVPRPEEVTEVAEEELHAVLAVVGFDHLHAADLCDGVIFVGRLGRTGQDGLFLHGLQAHPRIGAGTRHEEQALRAMPPGRVDYVQLDHHVVVEEGGGLFMFAQIPPTRAAARITY